MGKGVCFCLRWKVESIKLLTIVAVVVTIVVVAVVVNQPVWLEWEYLLNMRVELIMLSRITVKIVCWMQWLNWVSVLQSSNWRGRGKSSRSVRWSLRSIFWIQVTIGCLLICPLLKANGWWVRDINSFIWYTFDVLEWKSTRARTNAVSVCCARKVRTRLDVHHVTSIQILLTWIGLPDGRGEE